MTVHPAASLKPRKKPAQQRSRDTWATILEAAAQVLARHGYAKTTTNLIAERAWVSVGTVYEYFPNKDVLLSELQSHWNDTCWRHVQNLPPHDPSLPLEHSVRLMFEHWVGVLLLNPELYAALVNELPTRGNKWKADARLNERIQLVAAALRQHAGRLRSPDVALSCEILIRGVQAYLDHLVVTDPQRLASPQLIDDLTEQFCGFMLHGFAAESDLAVRNPAARV